MPNTSSLANKEWGQETKDKEGVTPQLGDSNPMDNEEIHSEPVDTTTKDQHQTSFASIVLGNIDFSIAPPQRMMTIEMSSTKSKKQALALFA